jgi:hypothetical protein
VSSPDDVGTCTNNCVVRDPLFASVLAHDLLTEALNTQYCLYPERRKRLTACFLKYGTLYPPSPQSGDEKEARRSQYNRSKKAKERNNNAHKNKLCKKKWTEKIRKDFMKTKEFKKNDPHAAFISHISVLKEQAAQIGIPIDSITWSRIESLVFLTSSLFECTSYTQATSIFLLYLKTHYTESIALQAFKAFEALVAPDEAEDDDDVVPHGGKPAWLDMLRESMKNWRLVTTNPFFKKISSLISICISLGLCQAASFEWHLGGVKAFCIPAMEKHYGAFDLVDAAIETVLYFVEAGYACFTTKSVTPLLYSDIEAREFDEEYGFIVSNIEHVKTGNLRKFVNIDENEFDQRLTALIQRASDFHATVKGTWEKRVFFDRLSQLRKLKANFDSIRVQGGLRIAPFTMNIFGKSGVGKSSVGAISMVMCLLANGFCANDEMLATLNESDKYMSNYRSFINGLFMDDIGNTKPDFVEKAPTNKIIEICNNVRQYANMAEAELKGKVSIEPRVVVLTTNVKDLCAPTYSNEPVSIARRAHLTVTVTVKPEFCTRGLAGSVGQQLDSAKVSQYYTTDAGIVDIPLVPDLWNITVERVVPVASTKGSPDTIAHEIMTDDGELLSDIDIHRFIKFMIKQSRKYFAQQEVLVKQTSNIAARVKMCKCGTPYGYCDCEEPECVECEPHSGFVGFMFGAALRGVGTKLTNFVKDAMEREGTVIERMATKNLVKAADRLEKSLWYSWTNIIPRQLLTHPYGKRFVNYAMRDHIMQRIKRDAICTLSLASMFFLASYRNPAWLLPMFGVFYRGGVMISTVRERVHSEILERNDAMPTIFKQVRDNHGKYVLAALGAAGTIYTLLKVWQGFRNAANKTHGKLDPETPDDIDERDSEVNPWKKVDVLNTPTSVLQKTTSVDHLLRKVHKNQVFLRIATKGGYRVSGGIFIASNVLLMPYHMWFANADTKTSIQEELKVTLTRSSVELTGSTFDAIFSTTSMVKIPDTDFCLVWVPSGGDYADLVKYLPIDEVRGGLCSMIFRDGNGGTVEASANIQPGMVGHRESSFKGAAYNLSIPTFTGLCMGTFVTRGKACVIAGFHLGGRTGTPRGVLGSVNQTQVQTAMDKLKETNYVVLALNEGTMPTTLYGKEFFLGNDVHGNSPVNFLEGDSNFRVYGSCTGGVTAYSSVEPSLISDTVHEICKVPQKWGKPQFRPNWKPWRESLKHAVRPSVGIEGMYLQWAVDDYIQPLESKIVKHKWIRDEIRPLTRMETICGIDGRRFIDHMEPSTAVGYPLVGPKSAFMVYLDPADYPDHACPAELDSMFWDEVDRLYTCWLRGERGYPVFKGCLKDEPTPLDKDKVRVFQSAPIALQLAIRQYFLPIARFLTLHPLLSECAVGINSQGPEWNELSTFITKYGKDRIFAGDYSKYDLRMPAQIMFAAFRILIDLAKTTGNYSDDDIKIMQGIATEVCYPCMAYNGTLLQLIGSNPSGQNLTVYINSVANSLLNRCGYYHLLKKKLSPVPAFRSAVALMTYGDDVKGSVKKGFDSFNHISYAQFLSERDMKFTMPDKTSEPTPYMHDQDADFLKRKNVYNPDVKMYFGALDEDSIFKSLHANLRSKALTREELAVEVIDGAVREWFAHGREIYEFRREQMQTVAKRHNLVCRELDVTYDERLTTWKDKYIPNT